MKKNCASSSDLTPKRRLNYCSGKVVEMCPKSCDKCGDNSDDSIDDGSPDDDSSDCRDVKDFTFGKKGKKNCASLVSLSPKRREKYCKYTRVCPRICRRGHNTKLKVLYFNSKVLYCVLRMVSDRTRAKSRVLSETTPKQHNTKLRNSKYKLEVFVLWSSDISPRAYSYV